MYLIKLYGWAVMLCGNVSTRTLKVSLPGNVRGLKVNDNHKSCIDAIISSEKAKQLVLEKVSKVTGRSFAVEVIRRIDEGINLL